MSIYFEKERIDTSDGNGELLLTFMSSIAQEESRSISQNVAWGMHKRFADGKVSVPYKRFLGYEKGADGKPAIVESEAETVRFIYRMFIQGKTTCAISKELERRRILSPGGKKKWQPSTVQSILTNEKYKGDALLQKKVTVDYLSHKMVRNVGMLPQYYVEGSHPAIVEPDDWELVQIEMRRRKLYGNRYSGNNIFSSKIVCGECGGFYGQKVWHSTDDKYKREILRCNKKYDDGTVCDSIILDVDIIKEKFIEAYNMLLENRENLISDCTDIRDRLSNTDLLDTEAERLEVEKELVSKKAKELIKKNTSVQQPQEDYRTAFGNLERRFAEIEKAQEEIIKQLERKKEQAYILNLLISNLRNSGDSILEWNERLWLETVKRVVVKKKTLKFEFICGEIEVEK